MRVGTGYRTYSPLVKDEIAVTGNLYAFPHLKIPRTTAQYWAKKDRRPTPPQVAELAAVYTARAEFLETELQKERAMCRLLKFIRKIFPYEFSEQNVKSRAIRSQIVTALQDCQKHHTLAACLRAIGLSKSRYQRWSSEHFFCKRRTIMCGPRTGAQLSARELNLMRIYFISKKYAHLSISSLHLLAQRTGVLFCSIDTWYKYGHYFEWQRPRRVRRAKIYKVGIRSTARNQLWHIDVTVIPVRPGYRLYIQAVIDNFSRFVLSWRVSESIDAAGTVATLAAARIAAAKLVPDSPKTIVCDPGTENVNGAVTNFITSINMRRLVARVEVHYSNSMIERLFYSLKNNYLYQQRIRTIDDLKRKAGYYFKQHNHVIPQAVLNGGTPLETFKGLWTEEARMALQQQRAHALLQRRNENLNSSCSSCPAISKPTT